jgi:hypothetical protein
MAEVGIKRQRSVETTSLTPYERTAGLARRPWGGMDRSSQGYSPAMFSITPGEFFTMNPITLMRRFTDDIDRVVSGVGSHQSVDGFSANVSWMPAFIARVYACSASIEDVLASARGLSDFLTDAIDSPSCFRISALASPSASSTRFLSAARYSVSPSSCPL